MQEMEYKYVKGNTSELVKSVRKEGRQKEFSAAVAAELVMTVM